MTPFEDKQFYDLRCEVEQLKKRVDELEKYCNPDEPIWGTSKLRDIYSAYMIANEFGISPNTDEKQLRELTGSPQPHY